MSNAKNIFDQTLAGEYNDDAQYIKRAGAQSAKTKLLLKRPLFTAQIGGNGYLRATKTVELQPMVRNTQIAKISDFGTISIKGRR